MNTEKLEEPKEKRQHTEVDFNLCIKCQIIKQESLRLPQRSSSEPSSNPYDKFLQAVRLRASFGNSEYVTLCEKVGHMSGADLASKNVMWHKSCYSMTTNKEHIKCDEK